MSACLGPSYNPIPPRQWSRFVPNRSDPINGESFLVAQNRKGNILQYKNNSSNLTQKEKYSLVAQGKWTYKKSYGTQTESYTDPNISSLSQQNTGSTTAFIPNNHRLNCNPSSNSNKGFIPANSGGPTPPNTPIIPPPVPPPTHNPNPLLPPIVPNPTPAEPSIIPDGGNLNSCAIYDHCSNQYIKQYNKSFCNPTSASDVPQPTITLCYNPAANSSFYPRTRRTYSAGSNKWPTNAKPIFSAN